MSETATLEAPAAVAAPAPAAPVAPTPEPQKIDVHSFLTDAAKAAPDALSGLLPAPTPFGRKPISASPAPVTPPVTPPVAPAATTTAAPPATPAAPVVAPTTPATPAPENPEHAKNWRVQAKDAKEAMVMQAMKNGASLQEAYVEVYGTPQPEAPAPTAQPATPAAPLPTALDQADNFIKSLADNMATIEADMDKAVEANDLAALNKLQRQHSAKTAEIATAKLQRESMRQAQQDAVVNERVENHRQLVETNVAKSFELYPKLQEAKSPERAQFNLKVAELESDPAFGPNFRQTVPGWPLMVARMVAEEQGWSRQTVAQSPATVATPSPAPTTMTPTNPLSVQMTPAPAQPRATSVELVTASASPGSATPTVDVRSFLRDSATASPEQLRELLKNAPTDWLLKAEARAKRDPRRIQPR